MTDLHAVLLEHMARYPEMEPRDAVKLLYQSAFGGGHLIPDPSAALARLREEMDPLPQDGGPLAETVGGGFFRLHLRAAKREGLSLETVNALFVLSAQKPAGKLELDALEALARAGATPFSEAGLAGYLKGYRAEGCPMVSHTERYRAAYAPAYRIVADEYRPLLPLLAAVDRRLAGEGAVSVAIDGRCGGGKTTLAARLAGIYPDARVVHMDDFFLPPEKRTARRLAQPGANVHYERFLAEAAAGIRTGRAFAHRVFDCSQDGYAGWKRFPAGRLTVVEGSYSLRPDLRELYTLRVFAGVEPAEQRRRLLEREGAEGFAMFEARWIPLEERYLKSAAVQACCQFTVC